MFIEKAYAKINLFLHVTDKRPDGYHILDSLVVFPDVGDELILFPVSGSKEDRLVELEITGQFVSQLSQENQDDNLIVKAAYKLAACTKQPLKPVKIQLIKNLPVASGIGGGSSDAAATLRLLMRYWNLVIDNESLQKIALQLGADVPVCLNPVTQRMQGIGEVISRDIKIPSFGMILVNHGEGVSTAEVFKKRQSSFFDKVNLKNSFDNVNSFIHDITTYDNNLQEPAILLNSKIEKVLEEIRMLPHCRLARMSGSGATCFGLFETVEQAQKAAEILSSKYSWWIWGGKAIH